MTETGILIKEIFDPYLEAPLEIWESFATFLKRNSYKKNEIIKDVNKKENNLSIITKGSAGIFLWKENSSMGNIVYEIIAPYRSLRFIY
jgi:signal-transduction protein with cAMP-binding, CBS, and nucleotidyltransferase domain